MAAILAYLVWMIVLGWPAITSATPNWDGLNLAGAFISGLAAYQCLFFGWLFLLDRAGYLKSQHLGSYARIWWISYLYRYVPGKVLLLVERARLGSSVGIPPSAGATIAVIETIFAILAGVWVSLLAITFYTVDHSSLITSVIASSIVVLFLLPVGFRLFCSLPIARKRLPELGSIKISFRDALLLMVPYILHFLLVGLSFFLWTQNFQSLTWSAFPGLCGIYALSHVVGLVTLLAPGGLGVREGVLSFQLGRMIPTGLAEIVAIGARVWFTLIELVCLAVVVLFCPQLPTSREANDPTSHTEP